MRTQKRTLRGLAGAVAVGLGMLAVGGPAGAAGRDVPFGAIADTTALDVRLTLAGGLPGAPKPFEVQQVVSQLNTLLRGEPELVRDGVNVPAVRKVTGSATAIALTINGLPATVTSIAKALEPTLDSLATGPDVFNVGEGTLRASVAVSTTCESQSCSKSQSAAGIPRLDLSDLGHASVGLAESTIDGVFNPFTGPTVVTQSGVTEVNLGAASLLGPGKPLAALGQVLDQLTATVNDSVLPVVADAVKTVRDSVPKTVMNLIDDYVTITLGDRTTVRDIPNLSEVDLLDLTVLPATSNIAGVERKTTVEGIKTTEQGVVADAGSRITDVSILGDWVTIGSVEVGATAKKFAGSGKPTAFAKTDIVGVEVGGLLGLKLPLQGLINLADREVLKQNIREAIESQPAPVRSAVDELLAAVDLVYDIAGVSVRAGDTLEKKTKDYALASANTLTVRVAPQVPKLEALQRELAAGRVPRLAPGDYSPAGVVLEVDFPKAQAAVGNMLAVQPTRTRTGVASHGLLALMLIGLALVARRFVLAR